MSKHHRVWPDPGSPFPQRAGAVRVELSDGDSDEDEEVVTFEGASALAQAAVQQRQEQQRQLDENKQYELLAVKVKSLVGKVTELRDQNKSVRTELRVATDQNKDLKQKIENLQEQQEELETALSQVSVQVPSAIGSAGHAASGANAGSKRNLEDEDRRRRAAAKSALLAGAAAGDDEEDVFFSSESNRGSVRVRLQAAFNRWFAKRAPLAGDVRTVQARYGSSVASYFMFYRWLVSSYTLAAAPAVAWLVVHCLLLAKRGSFPLKFVGVVPGFMAYSSFNAAEGTTYTAMVALVMALQAFSALRKWLQEDRLRCGMDLLDEEQKHVQFARTFLVGWDNSLVHKREVEDLRTSNGLQLAVLLAEDKMASNSASRTLSQKCVLFLRRFCGFLLYISLQVLAWYAIVLLTSSSNELARKMMLQLANVDWLRGFADTLSVSIVPIAVTVINTIMPIIINIITEQEQWDSAKTITYMLVTRMYLAKILNALIQAASFMLLANPYTLTRTYSDVRRSVEQSFNQSTFSCRIDQASSGLFQLVITEFVAAQVINSGVFLAKKGVAWMQAKPYVRSEFEVAKRMVSLLYFQALILASFPLFPMSPIFVTIFLVLSFKSEKYLLLQFQSKPKRPWRAQDAGAFFIKFYLVTFLLVGVAVSYFTLSSSTFAKDCAVQDATVSLCTTAVSADADTCSVDSSSGYYSWFAAASSQQQGGAGASSSSSSCTADSYPACVCAAPMACGPFTTAKSAWSVADVAIRGIYVFGYAYALVVDHVIIAWAALLAVLCLSLFRKNALVVQELAARDRDRAWANELATAKAKIRRQTKHIEKLEVQAGLLHHS